MSVFLPSIKKTLEFVKNTPEACQYFLAKFTKILTDQGVQNKFSDLLTELEKYSADVQTKCGNLMGNIWNGGPVPTQASEEIRAEQAQKPVVTPEIIPVAPKPAPALEEEEPSRPAN
jgi:hypothetical protein